MIALTSHIPVFVASPRCAGIEFSAAALSLVAPSKRLKRHKRQA